MNRAASPCNGDDRFSLPLFASAGRAFGDLSKLLFVYLITRALKRGDRVYDVSVGISLTRPLNQQCFSQPLLRRSFWSIKAGAGYG